MIKLTPRRWLCLSLIGAIALVSACSDGGVGAKGSAAWYLTASDEAIRRHEEAGGLRTITSLLRSASSATGSPKMTSEELAEYEKVLQLNFETTCKNYGYKRNTAAFNQCVGLERNNYERQLQLEQIEADGIARDREAARKLSNAQLMRGIELRRLKSDQRINELHQEFRRQGIEGY